MHLALLRKSNLSWGYIDQLKRAYDTTNCLYSIAKHLHNCYAIWRSANCWYAGRRKVTQTIYVHWVRVLFTYMMKRIALPKISPFMLSRLAPTIKARLRANIALSRVFKYINYIFKCDFFTFFFAVLAVLGLASLIPLGLLGGLLIGNVAILVNAKRILALQFWWGGRQVFCL